jgi:hypothetical protein
LNEPIRVGTHVGWQLAALRPKLAAQRVQLRR